jgi:hypothetical protein
MNSLFYPCVSSSFDVLDILCPVVHQQYKFLFKFLLFQLIDTECFVATPLRRHAIPNKMYFAAPALVNKSFELFE